MSVPCLPPDRGSIVESGGSCTKGTDRNFRGCIDSFDTDASLMHRSRIDSESIYSTQNACKHLAQHHMRRKESIPIDIFRYQIVRIADASMNQNIGISIRTLIVHAPGAPQQFKAAH